MPDTSGHRSTAKVDRHPKFPSSPFDAGDKPGLLSLAELYYDAHLTDLIASSDSEGLFRFIHDIFGSDAVRIADAQKEILGRRLLEWAAVQMKSTRSRVWMAFGGCNWVLPLLEIVGRLPELQRGPLLDVEPMVLLKVIGPYLEDKPRKVKPIRLHSGEENLSADGGMDAQPLV